MSQITLLVGCSTGIGLAIASAFAKDQLKRFLVYATILKPLEEEKEFQETVGSVIGETLFPVQMDVTKEQMIKDVVAKILDKHGRIDVLVYNAGMNVLNVSEAVSDHLLDKVFKVNFFGLVKVTREVLPVMKKQRSGRIINIGSMQGLLAYPYMGLYGATKHAIEAFSQETAVIGRFFNVRVSVIVPGVITTKIMENMIEQGHGGHAEIERNPDINDLDKAMSTCFDHGDEFHNLHEQPMSAVTDLALRVVWEEKPHFRYYTSQECFDIAHRFRKDPTGDALIDHQVACLKPYAIEPVNKQGDRV